MTVSETVSIVSAGTNMDLRSLAHEVVIVDALIALASAHVSQHLGQATMHSGVNEGGTVGMVLGTADCNRSGIAIGVVVEGAAGYAAVCNMSRHRSPFHSSVPARQVSG